MNTIALQNGNVIRLCDCNLCKVFAESALHSKVFRIGFSQFYIRILSNRTTYWFGCPRWHHSNPVSFDDVLSKLPAEEQLNILFNLEYFS